MPIDLTLVQSFLAVAEELSFARAAERLYVAQPALSQRILRFEELLNMRLFTRTTRSVELTVQGRAVYDAAVPLLVASRDFDTSIGAIQRGKSQQLKVAYTASTGFDTVPRLVTRFLHIHPEVDVVAREMWSSEMIPAIEHGFFDVGVGRSAEAGSRLETEVICSERMVAVMESTHPLATRSSIRLAELKNEKFMFFPPEYAPGYFASLVGLCRGAGFQPKVIDNPLPGVRTFSTLCQNGAIALRPASARLMKPEGISFVEIEDETAVAPVVLIWKPGAEDNPAIQHWIDNAHRIFDAA